MSVDFKLMFVYHGTMLVLFATGQLLSTSEEIAIAVLLAVFLLAVAAKRRSNMNWRRPQIGTKHILAAIGTAASMSLFLFAATPLFPPTDHRALPWYLAGGGIGFFWNSELAWNCVQLRSRISRSLLDDGSGGEGD